MSDGLRSGGLIGLIVAKVVCCGGLILIATGALSGIGAWLADAGVLWLVAVGIAVVAVILLWRRRNSRGTMGPSSGHQVHIGRSR